MKLTPTQQLAVEAKGKNILVSAGAGTGKTRVLVERFLHFATQQQIPVTEILALTYTEKAANEMKSRLFQRLGEMKLEKARRDLESAYISTIHAFAARLLREHPIEAGVAPDFRVIEAEESDFLKDQALDEAIEKECQIGTAIFDLLKTYGEREIRAGLIKLYDAARHEGKTLSEFFTGPATECSKKPVPFFPDEKLASDFEAFSKRKDWDWQAVESFKEWRKSFSRRGRKNDKADWKKAIESCDAFLALKIDEFSMSWRQKIEPLALLFEQLYESRKKEESVLDFDDLQIKALKLFKKQGAAYRKLLERYQQRFRLILVDEFQDTNPLQLEFIELLSSGDNLFFVGDFKQSIYAFRGAEPSLFLEKERECDQSKTAVKIPLLENFRTEETVLEFINQFFKNLWNEDTFHVEDLIARIETTNPMGVELLTAVCEEAESLDHARLREAQRIASRIRELHEEGVKYGDMAILFQTTTSCGIYEQALKREGIPYFMIAGRGFYHQPEIRDMMSYLAHLDNPLSDIPLAAVLRSPLFQVNDNTLYWLAQYGKKDKWDPLYQGVKKFEEIAEITEPEKEKLRFYFAVTKELRDEKDKLCVTELLEKILTKTSYEIISLADSQGVRRYANLKKLISLAREYEAHEPISIGAFLRIIKRLETHEIRESEAQVEAEKSGRVVRLLTIHKAKGLEFPVVFVADLARQRQSPESNVILAEAGKGYSLKVWNEISLDWEKPQSWQNLYERKKQKESEEWKRLFYVAMTRAKSRLILSGVDKGSKSREKESFYDMASWMDWVLASPPEILEKIKIQDKEIKSPGRMVLPLVEKKIFKESEKILSSIKNKEAVIEKAQIIFNRLQPPSKSPSRVINLPVSAYAAYQKNKQDYFRIYEVGYPSWLMEMKDEKRDFEWNEEEGSSADFGTAMHYLLERLDFKSPKIPSQDQMRSWFRGMGEEKKEEAIAMLKSFMKSPLFERLRQAKILKRELPFVLNERHGMIYGVIDLLFQDAKGQWVVLDYKTGLGSEQKIKEMGYDLQIQIYALAVQLILKQTPSAGILYFLKNEWQSDISFNVKGLEQTAQHLRKIQEALLGVPGSAENLKEG